MVSSDLPSRHRVGDRVPLGDTSVTVRYETPTSISPNDVSSAIEVLGRAFNGGPSWFHLGVDPSDHFIWKATSAPGDGAIELLEHDKNVVGLHLFFRERFQFNGTQVFVEVGNDSAIDPRFQGRGINSLISKLRPEIVPLEPACFAVDLQIHPHLRNAIVYPIGNQIDALAKPLNLRKLIASRRGKDRPDGPSDTRQVLDSRGRSVFSLRRGELQFAARLGASIFRRSAVSTDDGEWTIRTAERFDARADMFWQEAATQFDLIQVRDQAWLNWRFCDARGGPFTVRVAEQDGALLGYAAIRVTEHQALIADLLTLPGREDVAESLVADAVGLARQAGAPMLRCWMARQHPYRPALWRAGFVRYELPAPVVFEPRGCNLADLEFLTHPTTRVHFMTADTDHI